MTNPLKLVVSFASDGTEITQMVPMSDAEYQQAQADAAAAAAAAADGAQQQANASTFQSSLQSQITAALALADKLDAGTATAAEQRNGLSMCLHGLVRLTKVVYRTFDQPA